MALGEKKDKYGRPFIAHVLTVARFLDDEIMQICAILHDLPEDCPEWTFDRLRGEGFCEEILHCLRCLTKNPGESYSHYLRRAMSTPVSCAIKIADLTDNLDSRRIIPKNVKKYELARLILLRHLKVMDAALFTKTLISQNLQELEKSA
jgi:(p)ppGpp synthase/HD superfamily hydrolase